MLFLKRILCASFLSVSLFSAGQGYLSRVTDFYHQNYGPAVLKVATPWLHALDDKQRPASPVYESSAKTAGALLSLGKLVKVVYPDMRPAYLRAEPYRFFWKTLSIALQVGTFCAAVAPLLPVVGEQHAKTAAEWFKSRWVTIPLLLVGLQVWNENYYYSDERTRCYGHLWRPFIDHLSLIARILGYTDLRSQLISNSVDVLTKATECQFAKQGVLKTVWNNPGLTNNIIAPILAKASENWLNSRPIWAIA